MGGEGGWDYLCLDGDSKRLFIPRGDRVMVTGLDGTPKGEIPGTEGVHGVALSKALGRGWTSNGKSDSITVFDYATLKVEKVVKSGGSKPDAILYDSASDRVFVANGHGDSITVLDARSSEVLATVPVAGNPETLVSDGRGRVYFNIESTAEIGALDARDLKVTARWTVKPLEEPTGLALDREHGLLFSVGKNKLMAVVRVDTGRVITTLPIGLGADGAAYDAGTGVAYASCGEGKLVLVRQDAPGHFISSETATGRGAKTLALDPATHRVYLPTADFKSTDPNGKGTPVPGSFHVLVVGAIR